jgi:hypothetical protein
MNEGKIYKEMYLHLFNKVTDVIKMLEESNPNKAMGEAVAFLRMAQMKCDDIYIEGDDYFNEDI